MGSASLLAWLANGCVLIDYDQQLGAIADAGGIEPIDSDGSLDARGPDADGGSDASRIDASPAKDAALADSSHTEDGGTADAGDGDSSGGDAGDAALIACTSLNECGGCAPLAKLVGDACGSCGVGTYACDGTEALTCANDGTGKSPGNPVLIDDLEDGDENILSDYGLSGEWYMVADATGGTLTPAVGTVPVPANVGATGSARSMHFTATGFTRWGAGMGVSLNAHGCSYDTSKQTGIEFHIKGTGSVIVSVATKQTVPVADHGTCTTGCNDGYSVTMPVPTSWSLRKAVFANLKQAGWGTAVPFDPSQVLYVQFQSVPGSTLDLYVDNLSFY